jgi:xylulokinase
VLGGREGVFKQTVGASNACAIGGANKAAWAALGNQGETFEDFIARHWDEQKTVEKLNAGYDADMWRMYGEMLPDVAIAEKQIASR